MSRKKTSTSSAREGQARRNALVFLSLIMALGITSILLFAISPAPLKADLPSLLATENQEPLEAIFQTQTAIRPGHWRTILIHQSKTRSSDSLTRRTGGPADHFLIGNGEGLDDGEIQVGLRWIDQQPAAGGADSTININLVGDFDRTTPTTTQLRQAAQLAKLLQRRLGIPAASVKLGDKSTGPSGIGKRFPIVQFQRSLAP